MKIVTVIISGTKYILNMENVCYIIQHKTGITLFFKGQENGLVLNHVDYISLLNAVGAPNMGTVTVE